MQGIKLYSTCRVQKNAKHVSSDFNHIFFTSSTFVSTVFSSQFGKNSKIIISGCRNETARQKNHFLYLKSEKGFKYLKLSLKEDFN